MSVDRNLQPVSGLTGVFLLKRGVNMPPFSPLCSFVIPGHNDLVLTDAPLVVLPDPNLTGQQGNYENTGSDLIRGPVTATLGRVRFSGNVTDGYYKGRFTHNVTMNGSDSASWEHAWWFTFSGDWSDGSHSFGEIHLECHGGTVGGITSSSGSLTMDTRTKLLVLSPIKPKRIRKVAAAAR